MFNFFNIHTNKENFILNLIKESTSYLSFIQDNYENLKEDVALCNKKGTMICFSFKKISIEQYKSKYQHYSSLFLKFGSHSEYTKYRDTFQLILDELLQTINLVSHYIRVFHDVQLYLEKISDDYKLQFNLDKNNLLYCIICDFSSLDIQQKVCHTTIAMLYGNLTYYFDYDKIGVCKIAVNQLSNKYLSHIELCCIDVKGNKRNGIGTDTLKFIEIEVTKEITRRINLYNLKYENNDDFFQCYPIRFIQGTSSSISIDTDENARKNFYKSSGYIFKTDRIFQKTLSQFK